MPVGKISVHNHLLLVMAGFALVLAFVFLLNLSIVAGLVSGLISWALWSCKNVFALNSNSNTLRMYSQRLFWKYALRLLRLPETPVKVLVVECISVRVNGTGRRNEFHVFDVLLMSAGNRKTKVLTTVEGASARKLARFLALRLQVGWEEKTERSQLY